MEAIILRTNFFVPFLFVVVVSDLRHPRNLAENKQSNGDGNRAGMITLVFPAKKKNIILDSGLFQRPDLQPETKTEPQLRSHWTRLIDRAHAIDTRSSRGAKDIEQHARLLVHHRTRGEGEKPKEKQRRKKRKNAFLITSLDSAARSSSYNGGQQQERGTVDMEKRASLSRSFSPQFGVGSKGEKPIAAVGASESKRWITRETFRSLFLSFLSLRSVV